MYEKNLNYFRGLFAFMILLVHVYQIFLLPFFYDKDAIVLKIIQILGAYSVVGFILISGFSIARSLHKNHLKSKDIDIKGFILKRAKRIYPPFLFSLIVIVAVVSIIQLFQLNGYESYKIIEDKYVARDMASFDWKLLILNLLFLPKVIFDIGTPRMNGPLWSLNFEVYYYMILFLLISTFTYFKSSSKLKLLISLILLTALLSFQFIYKNYINRQFLYLLVIFLIGSISYLITVKFNINKYILKIILFIFIISNIYFIMFKDYIFLPYRGDAAYLMMVAISIMMILSYVLFFRNKNLFYNDFFQSASKYSYSLYILHFPLLLLSFSIIHPYMHQMNFTLFLLLLFSLLIIIVNIAKYSSYITERKNYL